MKNDNIINNKAFSLIELSIVLIIMGLLTAGITGGQSLIEAAKIRATINELESWKQASTIFYSKNDRIPGDVDGIGTVGGGSSYDPGNNLHTGYSAGTFVSPYDGVQPDSFGPFIELYLDGSSDFRPNPTPLAAEANKYSIKTAKAGYYPVSKVFRNSYYIFWNFDKENVNSGDFNYNSRANSPYLYLSMNSDGTKDGYSIQNIKMLKNIDEKIDDGNFDNGTVITYCKGVNSSGTVIDGGKASYDEAVKAIQTGKTGFCDDFFYYLQL